METYYDIKATTRGALSFIFCCAMVPVLGATANLVLKSRGDPSALPDQWVSSLFILFGYSITGGIVGMLLALSAFWTTVGPGGVRKGIWRQFAWKDIDAVRIEAISIPGASNSKGAIRGYVYADKRKIRIPIGLYKDQGRFLQFLKSNLPWADSLTLDSLPSAVTRDRIVQQLNL